MENGVGDVPHQVPGAPLRFVNREAELAAIGTLGGATTRIGVFSGLAGVGKTSLLRKVAERGRGSWPGGELHVEFAGERSVSDALASCLFALGVAESALPSRLVDRVGLFRTRTASQATLVVLDDVSDPAQVTPLVPSAPGSAVLVGSTARLTELELDGAVMFAVDPLTPAAGAHLMRELCGDRVAADPDALAALVEVCGGLPLALRAAAARLMTRRSMTVAEVVTEIAESGRQEVIYAAFDTVYNGLSGEAAWLYRMIGTLPGNDFDLQLVAAASHVAVRTCAALIDELVTASLLVDGDRYRLHTLVRRHANERALAEDPPSERLAALGRALEFLLVNAAFADRAVLGEKRYRVVAHDQLFAGHADPFGADKAPALAWLEAHRSGLAGAIRAAVDHEFHELAWQLAEAASALYVQRRYLVDWAETSELGVRAASLAGNAAAEARLRSFSSRPWTELGELDRARAELDAALSLASKGNDLRLLASVYEMDGRWYDATADHANAIAAYRRAIELFANAQDKRGVAFVNIFLGRSLLAAGDSEQAVEILDNAVRLVDDVAESRMLGRAMIAHAEALDARGNRTRALVRLDGAVAILSAGGDLFYEAKARELLAKFAARREHAGAQLQRAHEIYARLGSPHAERLERELGEFTKETGSRPTQQG